MAQAFLICLHEIPPLVIYVKVKKMCPGVSFFRFYGTLTKFLGKVIFSDASVILSTGGLCIMLLPIWLPGSIFLLWGYLSLIPCSFWGSFCPGSLSRGVCPEGVSVQGISVQRRSLSRGFSVQRERMSL